MSETIRSSKQNEPASSLEIGVMLTLPDTLHRSLQELQKTVELLGLNGPDHTVAIERRRCATLDST
jgi:hypothetical protein